MTAPTTATATEIWADVPEFEGYYQAGSLGSVKSLPRKDSQGRRIRGVTIKQQLHSSKPYKRVVLWKNGVKHELLSHVVILTSFVGPRPRGYETRHGKLKETFKGKVIGSNVLSNLSWGTPQDNTNDKVREGSLKLIMSIAEAEALRTEHAAGGVTIVALAKRYGCHVSTIRNILRRRTAIYN